MTCDRASDLLVELACGELTPELTAAVRSHAEGCARCGPELARFARVMDVAEALPLAEPSKAVEERILRAARQTLAARAGSTEAREAARELSGPRSWFARLSEWALSPQVAMASVLLLMVGIGLYSLPIGREQERVAFEATPDERAPAASATANPATPSAGERDGAEERGQGRTSDEGDQGYAAESARDEQLLKVQTARKARVRAAGSKSSTGLYDDAFGGLGEATNGSGSNVRAERSPAGPVASSPLPMKSAPSKAMNAPAEPAFAPAPPAAARTASAPKPDKAMPDSKRALEAEVALQETRGAASEPAEEKAADASQGQLGDGIAAARRGAYAQAVSLLTPLVNQGTESAREAARLWLARSLRGQGKCTEAVRYYGPLAQRADAPADVLSEAADCYDRTGDSALAGKLRGRLNAGEHE